MEETIQKHLEAWELANATKPSVSFEASGMQCTNVRIEQAYKGNDHLLGDINGKERKYVISKNKPEHAIIEAIGAGGLTDELLRDWVKKYLLPRSESQDEYPHTTL